MRVADLRSSQMVVTWRLGAAPIAKAPAAFVQTHQPRAKALTLEASLSLAKRSEKADMPASACTKLSVGWLDPTNLAIWRWLLDRYIPVRWGLNKYVWGNEGLKWTLCWRSDNGICSVVVNRLARSSTPRKRGGNDRASSWSTLLTIASFCSSVSFRSFGKIWPHASRPSRRSDA